MINIFIYFLSMFYRNQFLSILHSFTFHCVVPSQIHYLQYGLPNFILLFQSTFHLLAHVVSPADLHLLQFLQTIYSLYPPLFLILFSIGALNLHFTFLISKSKIPIVSSSSPYSLIAFIVALLMSLIIPLLILLVWDSLPTSYQINHFLISSQYPSNYQFLFAMFPFTLPNQFFLFQL